MKKPMLRQFWKIESIKSGRVYDGTLYEHLDDAFKVAPMNSLIRKIYAVEL